jgi:uncharacterized protein
MFELGKINTLKVLRKVEFGFYLGIDDKEILLPQKGPSEGYRIDDSIDVFVYRDSDDRLIASTQYPFALVGEFAFLEAVDINSQGAFLDWGIEKDLLAPFAQQAIPMKVGNSFVVYIYVDTVTNRIAATTKFKKYFDLDISSLQENDVVEVLVYSKGDLGYNLIVNNKYNGLAYHNEVYENIRIGDKLQGYISKLREDGKLDVRFQKSGYELVDDAKWKIVNDLKKHQGFLPFSDATSPEEIKKHFQLSKKAFKKAIGALYKERQIEITSNGIKLVEKK